MNRRSFLRRLAGAFTAPLAAIPLIESKFAGLIAGHDYDYVTLYKTNGSGQVIGEPIVATIGESVSWHLTSDKDGNAVMVYEEDDEFVKNFYSNWNKPSKG